MATEKELYDAFLTFGVDYLEDQEVPKDPKVLEAIAKVILKIDTSDFTLPSLPAGSVGDKKLKDLEAQYGSAK